MKLGDRSVDEVLATVAYRLVFDPWLPWKTVGTVSPELGTWRQKISGFYLPSLICKPQVPVTEPVSKAREMAPEEWHPRLTSGFHMYAHTSAHSQGHICAPAHTCMRTHRNFGNYLIIFYSREYLKISNKGFEGKMLSQLHVSGR